MDGNQDFNSRSEARKAQAAKEAADLQRSAGQNDLDALDELYNEYVDENFIEDDDDAEDEGGVGEAVLDANGERIGDQKKRLAKEKRAALTQSQKLAAAAARKEAREAKAAQLAKEKEAAKEAALAAAKEGQKDHSQRTLWDMTMGSQKGKLDIDKRLAMGGGDGEDGGGMIPANSAAISEVLAQQRSQQGHIAALGKSILAGLGSLSSDEDDDDDAGGIDLNAALFGDIQETRGVASVFGKTSATAADIDSTNAATLPSSAAPAVVDRLGDEDFDYSAVAGGAKKAPKKPVVAATTAAASTPTPSSAANKSASNFKQREAGVVASTEHITTAAAASDDNDADSKEEAMVMQSAAAAAASEQGKPLMGAAAAAMIQQLESQQGGAGKKQQPCLSQSHGTFYWLDAKEVGPHSNLDAGSVYLIGKLMLPNQRHYESCCVRIHNMYRSLMFRALPGSTDLDVVQEIDAQLKRQGIKQSTIKPVMRYYCFDEPDVPREKREIQKWYKVNYSAHLPLFQAPQPIQRAHHQHPTTVNPDGSVSTLITPIPLPGFKHIELCIGAERSLIETFLLKRRFTSGPCFVRFNERLTPVASTARVSHCKHEFVANRPKNVFPWNGPFESRDYNVPIANIPIYINGSMCLNGVPMQTSLTSNGSLLAGSPNNRFSGASQPAPVPNYSPSSYAYLSTQQYFSPPAYAPNLSGAPIQLITQMNHSGNQTEIFAICIAMCQNSILPDGGKKNVPHTEHVLLIRPFDNKSPLPLDLSMQARSTASLRVTTCANEKEMLQWVVDFLVAQDPDVLLGHNFLSFTLDVLLHRMQHCHVLNWSALGRIRQSTMPMLQKGAGGMREATWGEKEACLGRLVCDTYLLAREHHKSSNYKLAALARELGLKGIYSTGVTVEMVEESAPVITRDLWTNAKDTIHVLGRCFNLSRLTFELAYRLDVIPLTKQLCAQSGTSWSRVLIGSRSERIEFLLLHAFYAQKYVLPEKKRFNFNNSANASAGAKRLRDADTANEPDMDAVGEGEGAGTTTTSKRSAKYKGGMVLEPISGLYQDYILLLDFNSLYPSLIQEFNICFTTVNRSSNPNAEVAVPLAEDLACGVCVSEGRQCTHKMILPRVIERLVGSRRDVKRRMKGERNEDVLAQLEIRQKALKLTANSLYGCLGFEYSRFYAQPLAELVTSKGRDTLSNTVALIPTVAPSLRVIYGDTDSVMMQTGVKDSIATVRELGQRVQAAVNKKYKKLEIGIDGVFRSILLMTKKKYAALSVDNWEGMGDVMSEVVKGLDMVRRDWCPLVRLACQDILHRILRGVAAPDSATAQHVAGLLTTSGTAATAGDEDDVLQFILAYMQKVAEDVRSGSTYELKEFVIRKSLTKEPESYKGDNFPHATVALRMKHRKEAVRVGDLIPYVICKEKCKLPNAQKVKAEDSNAAAAGEVKTEVVKIEPAADEDDNANEVDDITSGMMGCSKLSHHAYHEDEVKKDPAKHHLDVEWYLSTQIYPPVMRICQHIQGFSAAQLAEFMHLKNASQIAATAEANAEGGAASSLGVGGNTWGTFDTQYLSRFKTDRLEECFPLAVPLQVKCTKCNRISSLQPHDYVERNILPLFKEKKRDAAFKTNPYAVFPPFHLYSCSNCHSHFDLKYVANTMSLFIQDSLRNFYKKGGTAAEVAKIQSQVSYLRALFDVPHLPGTSPEVVQLHKMFALRCLRPDGRACTLVQADAEDATDPVKELVERTYRRVHGLRVDTDQLFKKLDIF